MKKHTTLKRLLAVALAITLALSVAIPALAAEEDDGYTITILGTEDTDYSEAERFNAYQIFDGDLNEAGYNKGDETNGNKPPMENQLADINWGTGIKDSAIKDLLAALMNDETTLADVGVSAATLAELMADPAYAAFFEGQTSLSTAYNAVKAIVEAAEEEKADDKATGNTYWDGVNHKYNDYYYTAITNAVTSNNVDLSTIKLGDLYAAMLAYYLKENITAAAAQNNLTKTNDKADVEAVLALDKTLVGAVSDEMLKGTAAAIAKVLADLNSDNNSAVARAFAAIVGKKGTDGYEYLDDENAIKSSSLEDGKNGWKIEVPASGYYLIVDTTESGSETTEGQVAVSDFMLGVFGNQTIRIKTAVPTVDKEIVNSDNPKGGDFEIGETIEFKLTGTLPENYGSYSEYYLEFKDTLSSGLDYDEDSVRVYLVITLDNPNYDPLATSGYQTQKTLTLTIDISKLNGGEDDSAYVRASDYADLNEGGYNVFAYADAGSNETSLNVVFKDLKSIDLTKLSDPDLQAQLKAQLEGYEDDDITDLVINANTEIVVTYTATLTADASIDLTSETNKVELIYSNDPTWERDPSDEDKSTVPPLENTPEVTVYTYTFGLEIMKQDENGNPLAGAGFALKKNVANEQEYYVYEKNSATNTGMIKKITASELQEYLGKYDLDAIEDWSTYVGKTLSEIASETGSNYNGTYDDWYLIPDGNTQPNKAEIEKEYALYDANGNTIGSITESELKEVFGDTQIPADDGDWAEYIGKTLSEIVGSEGDASNVDGDAYLIPPVQTEPTVDKDVTLYTLYKTDSKEADTVLLTKAALQVYFGSVDFTADTIKWEDYAGKTVDQVAIALGAVHSEGKYADYYLVPTGEDELTSDEYDVYTLYGPNGEIAQVTDEALKTILGVDDLDNYDWDEHVGDTVKDINDSYTAGTPDYSDYVLIPDAKKVPTVHEAKTGYWLFPENGTKEAVLVTEDELKALLGVEDLSTITGETYKGLTLEEIVDQLGASSTGATASTSVYGGYVLIPAGEDEAVKTAITTYYAVLTKNADGSYSIFDWVTSDVLDDYFGDEAESWDIDADGKMGEGKDGDTTYEGKYLYILTDATGIFDIHGLDDDSVYYLEEVITPDGYDTIGDVSVRYEAEFYEKDEDDHKAGELKSLKAYVNGSDQPIVIVEDGEYATDDQDHAMYSKLSAAFAIVNYPAGYLPGTGGSGTTMFYIAGGILLALALGFLVVINVKKPRKAE